MSQGKYSQTFAELVDTLSHDAPQALILDWWCRLERALIYYFIAYYGERPRTAFEAIRLVEKDVRLPPFVGAALDRLRITRNRLAHGHVHITSAEEAASYAT